MYTQNTVNKSNNSLDNQEEKRGEFMNYIRMWVTTQEAEKRVSQFYPSPTEASSFGHVTVGPVFLQHTCRSKMLTSKIFLRRLRTFREI